MFPGSKATIPPLWAEAHRAAAVSRPHVDAARQNHKKKWVKTRAPTPKNWFFTFYLSFLGEEIPHAVAFWEEKFFYGKRQFTDTSGHELSGMAAARTHAIKHVRELKAAMCDPAIQDLSSWTMTVVDANGKTVCDIGFEPKR